MCKFIVMTLINNVGIRSTILFFTVHRRLYKKIKSYRYTQMHCGSRMCGENKICTVLPAPEKIGKYLPVVAKYDLHTFFFLILYG
jgi:hypothetical protein